MANPEHVKIVRQGAEAIRKWCENNPDTPLDLGGAELHKIDLSPIGVTLTDLHGANLSGADLSEANLQMVKFKGADLSGANLHRAYLNQTDFTKVNLSSAWIPEAIFDGAWLFHTNFEGSLLLSAKFRQCHFDHTRMSDAKLGLTVFADCDLRGMIGLDKVAHYGPSTIGIDTILRSQGDIPREFLQGCGLPDHVIEYVKSLTAKQFYTCFLSHSSKDEPFPSYLLGKLRAADVLCWYFPESAQIGEKPEEEIHRAIHTYDKVVVICSMNALESERVISEIDEALRREKEEFIRRQKDYEKVQKGELSQDDFARQRYLTRILFPIRIDDYVFEGWKHPLRYELCEKRVIGDFRMRDDPEKFKQAFDKLLEDLKAKDSD
ncbi:MAG: toll/interleukin-1 receptor domain-containing protein [Calditrichaeota bacterium]|nr:toll/interleukin-1 receptor domain-containing protein [Calditrichota bacterium]